MILRTKTDKGRETKQRDWQTPTSVLATCQGRMAFSSSAFISDGRQQGFEEEIGELVGKLFQV